MVMIHKIVLLLYLFYIYILELLIDKIQQVFRKPVPKIFGNLNFFPKTERKNQSPEDLLHME